jgi:predicted nuclease with TOPRIM domain
MATMKNKEYARSNSFQVNSEKLTDLLGIFHTEHHKLKEELERMNYNYQQAIKEIGKLEAENDKLQDMINSSREWLKLCENLDGNMPSYELRQLDTRLRPERYIIEEEE